MSKSLTVRSQIPCFSYLSLHIGSIVNREEDMILCRRFLVKTMWGSIS